MGSQVGNLERGVRGETELCWSGATVRGQTERKETASSTLDSLTANMHLCDETGHEDHLFQKQLPGARRLGGIHSTCVLWLIFHQGLPCKSRQ